MSQYSTIPPSVNDMLIKLTNPNLDKNERDNICYVVEEIARACSKEAETYRRLRVRDYEEDRRQKRRRR